MGMLPLSNFAHLFLSKFLAFQSYAFYNQGYLSQLVILLMVSDLLAA